KMTNVFSSTATDTAQLKIGSDSDCLKIKVDSANGKVIFTGKTTSPSKACEETLKLSTVKAAFGNKDLTASGANTHTIDYSASGVKLDF
ncbi:hypothetical protein, partial [Campylobacter canadensis]|uniref:hypothetical protein n=1 Tax=Campylobacter canadensis TaxID=449520 RepID=UPI001CCF9F4D